MRGLSRVVAVGALAATTLVGAATAASAEPAHHGHRGLTCSGGDIASGTYRRLTITGDCTIPSFHTVVVRRGVRLAPGATLDAMTASTVRVRGNILVGRGAELALGCSFELTQPPFPGGPVFCPDGVSHDTVRGNIVANRPLTLKIDGVTVNGNIVSFGGGRRITTPDASLCEQRHPHPLNFPVKDNVIRGNVVIAGWHGCWLGYIRNQQRGNAVFVRNRTASFDSTEIVTNTIHGNLACFANSPAPQVGDSHGSPNTVTGRKLGQCQSL